MGIRGRPNFHVSGRAVTGQTNANGNDGTIARFGWKAQNKSLLLFSGEAYNVEMGITNELFQTEREENPACQFAGHPNSITNTDAATAVGVMSSIEKFSFFMRLLAPPVASIDTPGGAASITSGQALFNSVGCAFCHTPSFRTGNSRVLALANQDVNLFSDLLTHDMGVDCRMVWVRGKRAREIQDGSAMGTGAADLLHARWPHLGFDHRDQGTPEFRLRGEHRRIAVPEPHGDAEAASAQLPALVVGLDLR